MKLSLIISLALLITAVILFFVFRSKGEKMIQNKWNTLLQSETDTDEIRNIINLTSTVKSLNGYWEVIGTKQDNTTANMTNYYGNLDDIYSIDITFYWENNSFSGNNWTPKNKENIYVFFRE